MTRVLSILTSPGFRAFLLALGVLLVAHAVAEDSVWVSLGGYALLGMYVGLGRR